MLMRSYLTFEYILYFAFGAVLVLVISVAIGLIPAIWAKNVLEAASTVVTAIATVFIARYTLTLKRATDSLADISIRTADAQERDTRILQRAYLSVQPRNLHQMTDKTWIAWVAFVNGGNLPARNVRNGVRIALSDNGDKADFEDVAIEPGRVMISPKGEIERGTPALSDDEAEALRTRITGFWVYVWGRVEYDDGFGQPRWLIFCHRYNCSKPDIARVHHHHNDGN